MAESEFAPLQEFRELHARVRQLGETTNVSVGRQETAIAVLQQRVADMKEAAGKLETQQERLRDECEERATDTRKYAHRMVEGARAEAEKMVQKLADEWTRLRTEEKEERREETNRALVRTGLWVAIVTAVVTLVVEVAIARWVRP